MFDTDLELFYTDAEGDLKFIETVIRFENSEGVMKHGAIFYGKNNAGEIWVYTKNGQFTKPTFMKLDDLMNKITTYGKPTGEYTGESGYYNLKNTP